ncbi:RNase H [Hafnia phage yong3]|nr:RNase H [Hafnia phage yong3]
MRITIISDASYCPNTAAAGYGGWVVCNRGKAKCSGPLKGAPNSGAAETMAICNVFWHGLNESLIQRGDHIIIQTDCLTAIRVFKESKWTSEVQASAFKWLNAQCTLYSLSVEFRHVKGHSTTQDKRSAAQRYCDERAGEAMKLERSRIRVAQLAEKIKQHKKPEHHKDKLGVGLYGSRARLHKKAKSAKLARELNISYNVVREELMPRDGYTDQGNTDAHGCYYEEM